MGGSGDCCSPSNGDSEGGCSPARAASRFSCFRCRLSVRFSSTARSRLRLLIVCCRFLFAIWPPFYRGTPPRCARAAPRPPAGRRAARTRSQLTGQLYDVLRLGALGSLGSLVLDLRALRERLVAVTSDGRVVHEEILALILGGDESIPLRVVEPLHCPCRHEKTPPLPARER